MRGGDFISPAEVRRTIMRLPSRKAPGYDGITTTAIKQLPRRVIVALTRLYNGILRTGHFPTIWKQGRIIVLPKPGKDRRFPASYRPITLLPHIAKLFEKITLNRVLPHVTLREEQFGFRRGHSTTSQLARLTRVLHLLSTEYNYERTSVGVFLDIEKAFDRVWHSGLLYKMNQQTSFPPAMLRLVASFLADRSFYVCVEDAESAVKPIRAGVPQGSCLSPILYAAYTNDIPTLAGQLQEWEDDVELALYADDSAYFTSSRRAHIAVAKMQRLLDLLPPWLDDSSFRNSRSGDSGEKTEGRRYCSRWCKEAQGETHSSEDFRNGHQRN
ncbi:unnamed protein product [Parnassius mnemosyne]|uniref:Reverse transcriptase domain-containing protein n=1 Tax=Parnassius mnemosyne TaxID=213953 RepID=A0AAV1LSP4_9NEOP